MIERATHLRHVETRTLCTSLSYLNHNNFRGDCPRRLLWPEAALRSHCTRSRISRVCRTGCSGTRLSVYGWALYFGSFAVPVETDIWTNVCIRAARVQSGWLRAQNLVRRRFLMRIYRCPNCGTTNLFSDDRIMATSPLPRPVQRLRRRCQAPIPKKPIPNLKAIIRLAI